jgi:hypothetical protein
MRTVAEIEGVDLESVPDYDSRFCGSLKLKIVIATEQTRDALNDSFSPPFEHEDLYGSGDEGYEL